MENLTHSRNQNSLSLPKKSYNGDNNAKSFNYNSGKTTNNTTNTTNDDVFGGPSKFRAPTFSPRLEDYCEIFGSSRAAVSSIPVLNCPPVDDRDVYLNVRNQDSDYREVFGGFNDLDFAPSYEELFLQQWSKVVIDGDSSEDAWTEEVESWSGGTEHSGKSPCFSSDRDSCDSIYGSTEFNISDNKASQMSGGDTSETTKLKETGPSSGISRFAFEDKSYSSEPFVTVSDIGLKTHPTETPPSSRPPPLLKSGFRSSVSNSRITGSEGSVDSSSPPIFDVEVDESSAAEREDIIKAEAKPESGKELSEGKKDGALTTTKPTSTKNRMLEEQNLSHTTGLPAFRNNIDVTKKYLGDKDVSKSFSFQPPANSDGNDELKEPNQFVELVRTQLPRNDDKNSGGKDVSIPLNAELTDQEQTWTANVDQRRRAQGDRGDHESRTLSKHHGTGKVESTHKRHEDKLVEKVPEEKSRRVEFHFEMGNNLLRSEENKGFNEKPAKQKNELHCEEINKRIQNQQLNRQPHQKAAEKNQECVFEWEQNARNLREALGNESTLEVSLEMNGNGKNLGMPGDSETKLNEALKRMEEKTRIKEAHVREENERREREAFEKAEMEKILEEALQQEEKMKKIKEALEKDENEWRAVEAREKAEEERKMKKQRELELRLIEAFKREEKNRRMREAREKAEHERKMKVAREQEEERRIKEAHEKKENEGRVKEALEKAELEQRLKETLEQEEKERQIKELQEKEENERRAKEVLEQAETERNLKEAFGQKEKERKVKEAHEKEENEKKRKEAMELEEKEKRLIEAFERAETERKLKEVERLKKERDFLMERLRKIEEEKEREREREREREKDRMAFDQRALADARERLEKAWAEAREKSLPDKSSMEARLKAERAAVKRATAEARERAAEKVAFEARERMERSVFHKQFQKSVSFGASKYQNSPGIDGESPQRYTSRLERHRRTADRVAKALVEKNMRDLVAQREQAERIRIAETLDADVKSWSNGKEGNIRALLSTLQYILGPESGWQPLPLTEVITSAAVKQAYRKATLCVHPDKLQQRGANIHQKYICEKVFDLLKEAWNKFNTEER